MVAVFHIAVCRKPVDGTIVANVVRNGTGGLNIDGCRIGPPLNESRPSRGSGTGNHKATLPTLSSEWGAWQSNKGRFPANIIHDGSPEVIGEFPHTTSGKAEVGKTGHDTGKPYWQKQNTITSCFGDTGSASRFFKRIMT